MIAYLELIVLLSNQNCDYIRAAKIGNLLRCRDQGQNIRIKCLHCFALNRYSCLFSLFSQIQHGIEVRVQTLESGSLGSNPSSTPY